jgi:hypothetical protein
MIPELKVPCLALMTRQSIIERPELQFFQDDSGPGVQVGVSRVDMAEKVVATSFCKTFLRPSELALRVRAENASKAAISMNRIFTLIEFFPGCESYLAVMAGQNRALELSRVLVHVLPRLSETISEKLLNLKKRYQV